MVVAGASTPCPGLNRHDGRAGDARLVPLLNGLFRDAFPLLTPADSGRRKSL
jgi:hypothetical protein